MKFFRKANCKSASKKDIILATRQQGLVSFEMYGITYGGASSASENMTWDFYNETETTSSASIALPFPLPELPDFFTSWAVFGASALIFILGLIACCTTSYCKPSVSNDKSISLLDESRSKEPPLVKTLSIVRNASINSLTSVAKSLKDKIEIGSKVDNTKQAEEIGGPSSSRSHKTAACQTSFDKQSNRSQSSALDQVLKTLSNSFTTKQKTEQEDDVFVGEEELLETGTAASVKDKSSAVSSRSLNSKTSSRSKNNKPQSLAPIHETSPVTEISTTVTKSSTNSKSKKSTGSKKNGSKIFKMVFGGGKAAKANSEIEADAVAATMLSLADSKTTTSKCVSKSNGGIVHNSCMTIGKDVHGNVGQLLNAEGNGVVHETCMAVGEGVHLCVSPKILIEDQKEPVESLKVVSTTEAVEVQEDQVFSPKQGGDKNSNSDGIDVESSIGIIHSSLMNIGQGVHSLVPIDGTQDPAIGHDTFMAVGRGVQDFGEGFYNMLNKK